MPREPGYVLIFGLLDIANSAQPAFLILGSYAAYVLNTASGWPHPRRPAVHPVFYGLGSSFYRGYYTSFERRGEESREDCSSLRSPLHHRGQPQPEVRRRLPAGPGAYIGKSIDLGGRQDRLPSAGAVPRRARDDPGPLPLPGPDLLRAGHHGGVAGRSALRLMGANPVQIKDHRVRVGIAAASLAGAL